MMQSTSARLNKVLACSSVLPAAGVWLCCAGFLFLCYLLALGLFSVLASIFGFMDQAWNFAAWTRDHSENILVFTALFSIPSALVVLIGMNLTSNCE